MKKLLISLVFFGFVSCKTPEETQLIQDARTYNALAEDTSLGINTNPEYDLEMKAAMQAVPQSWKDRLTLAGAFDLLEANK